MNTTFPRLLLVDDEPSQLKLYKLALESDGFQIIAARDGQEALEMISQIPLEGVVSDVLMPRLDGFRLCQTIRENPRFAELPVVLLSSSYTEREDFRLAKDVRANALITRTADIKSTVNRILEGLRTVPLPGPVNEETKDLYVQRMGRQLERQTGALIESQERLHQIEENMRDVFFIVGPGGTPMHYVSPGYEKIWGRTCQSLYENPFSWLDAILPADRPAIKQWLRDTKDGDIREYRIQSPDGKIRWIRARTFQIRNAKDGMPRWVGSAEDITESKIMAEQLRQAQKMEAIGQIAAGVAHELNNPLSAILGFTQSLIHHPDAPDITDVLRTMEREALRCSALVQNMLSFTRKPAGEACLLQLPLLADSVLSLINAQAKVSRVTIEKRYEENLPLVRVNGNQIQQVLINLCTNAIDAMPRGGTLSVTIGQSGKDIVLEVSDTGSGIPAERIGKIFEAFFTTKEEGKGTGLGLNLAHDIVTKHKGRIDVQSDVERGTTFKVILPRGDAQ